MKKQILAVSVTALLTIIPATTQAELMLGAYVKGDGWSLAEIDRFNNLTTKPMAVVNLFSNFDYDWGYLKYQSDNIISRGAMPMISWMPSTKNQAGINLLTQISAGQWDAYIQKWINGFKWFQSAYPADKKPRILLRFAHEFNGRWYSWGNSPDAYKAAWRYLHAKFTAAGINQQIEWVWCINNVSADSYNDITRYYPGDDVVDWTGIDGYNWGTNYTWSRWKSFDETFSIPYLALVDYYPYKPILLGEVASAEPADLPNATYGQTGNNTDADQSKAVWVTNMFERLKIDYPAIRAVSWFNINKELSWALHNSNNTGLSEYNLQVSDPYYTSSPIPASAMMPTPSTP